MIFNFVFFFFFVCLILTDCQGRGGKKMAFLFMVPHKAILRTELLLGLFQQPVDISKI